MTAQTTQSDFETKTKRELTRLAAEAASTRARMPKHRPCSDKAPCRHCAIILALHEQADDHLTQLFDDDWLALSDLDYATPELHIERSAN